jgi:hypothetical protein
VPAEGSKEDRHDRVEHDTAETSLSSRMMPTPSEIRSTSLETCEEKNTVRPSSFRHRLGDDADIPYDNGVVR